MKAKRKTLTAALALCAGVLTSNAAQIYIDAPAVGTTVGVATYTGLTGTWVERTTGPAANAFATTAQQGTTSVPSASLTSSMTITGLTPLTTYTGFRIYYIGKANTDNWDFEYSYNGGSGTVLDETDGTIVDISNGGVGAPASTTGDIRYFVGVPDFTTDGAGDLKVDFARPDMNRDGTGTTSQRFVIDGLGYETIAVPEPSSALLALFTGGLFLVRRKR